LGSISNRLARLEDSFGIEEVEDEEEPVPVTREQQERAAEALTDSELETVEEVARRYGSLRGIPYKELTDRELKALCRFYTELTAIVRGEEEAIEPKKTEDDCLPDRT
jgi:hypothetical protein